MSRPRSLNLSMHFLLRDSWQSATPDLVKSDLAGEPPPARCATPALDRCSVALLDLAALEDGRLSEPGMARLALHVADCALCHAVLSAMLDDAERPEGTGTHPVGDSHVQWLPARTSD